MNERKENPLVTPPTPSLLVEPLAAATMPAAVSSCTMESAILPSPSPPPLSLILSNSPLSLLLLATLLLLVVIKLFMKLKEEDAAVVEVVDLVVASIVMLWLVSASSAPTDAPDAAAADGTIGIGEIGVLDKKENPLLLLGATICDDGDFSAE